MKSVGGLISGYSSTGRFQREISPEIVMTRLTTAAKRGCSMKNLENIKAPQSVGRLLGGVAGRLSRSLQDLDGFPFACLLHAFHNDNIVFLEPGGDEL